MRKPRSKAPPLKELALPKSAMHKPLHEHETLDEAGMSKVVHKDGTPKNRTTKVRPIEDGKSYQTWMKSTGLKRAFLAVYSECGNSILACNIVGLHPRQITIWLRDEDFAEDFDVATEYAVGLLEQEARNRALGGSDKLLEFLLKSLKPEVYRERYEVKQEVVGDYVIDISIPQQETKDSTSDS